MQILSPFSPHNQHSLWRTMASLPCSQSSAAIDHLTGGYERLTQLRALLSSTQANLSATTAQTMVSLLDKSLSCLAAALSEIQSRSPITAAAVDDSRSETNPRKRRRGKKMSWSIDTSVSDFDGHSWRKYGQKRIEGAEFPRTYYKCTYKDDRGCPAKKTVQKKEDDDSIPPKYEVCYIMQHTCKAMETDSIPVVIDPSVETNRSRTSSPKSHEQSISHGREASPDQLSPAFLPLQVEDMMEENPVMEPALPSTPSELQENGGAESWSNVFSPVGELDFDLDWIMSSSCNGEFDDGM